MTSPTSELGLIRLQVLTKFLNFLASWAADEAEVAARSTLHSPEEAAARLASIRAMCQWCNCRLGEVETDWRRQDDRTSRTEFFE
jgi:ADP-dependent phosphofructokinase/glucokinase